jgi:MYXO-CTERM domain-containing protein
VQQIFSFTLVPDDPMSSAKVPLTVTSRHGFGRVRVGVSGAGIAANGHAAFYSLRLSSPTGSRIGSDWSSEDEVVATEDTSFDVVHMEPEVFVNLKIIFVAEISQQSFASGSNGSTMGSASAELSSTVTYAFSTDDSTSIVFDMESLAGIPAPALDVVTVPEPEGWLLGLAALTGLVALRRRAL